MALYRMRVGCVGEMRCTLLFLVFTWCLAIARISSNTFPILQFRPDVTSLNNVITSTYGSSKADSESLILPSIVQPTRHTPGRQTSSGGLSSLHCYLVTSGAPSCDATEVNPARLGPGASLRHDHAADTGLYGISGLRCDRTVPCRRATQQG